jgi:hypothetical protein
VIVVSTAARTHSVANMFTTTSRPLSGMLTRRRTPSFAPASTNIYTQTYDQRRTEVVPGLVEVEVAVPHLKPAVR